MNPLRYNLFEKSQNNTTKYLIMSQIYFKCVYIAVNIKTFVKITDKVMHCLFNKINVTG